MAEKKSTKGKSMLKKRAVKKLGAQPAESHSQIDEHAKPPINWDVIGLSSTAIALVGTAFWFVLGWAYLVNWYGYFGVNISQVIIQPQTVFIQSIPATITLIIAIMIAVFIEAMIYSLLLILGLLFKKKRQQLIHELIAFNKRMYKIKPFYNQSWMFIGLITSFCLFIYLLILFYFNSSLLTPNYEFFYVFIMFFLVGILMIFSRIALFVTQKVVDKAINQKTDFVFQYAFRRQESLPIILSPILVLTIVSISSFYGLSDARFGGQGSGGWTMQPLSLVTSKDNSSSIIFPNQACDNDICKSGPFGYIGENETNIILVEWKREGSDYFEKYPKLYIIPKREDVYLIPFEPTTITTSSEPTSVPTIINSPTPQATTTSIPYP